MWYPLAVTVPASSEPIALDDAKLQCRVDDTVSDVLITRYISAARSHVEAYTGLRLMTQTVSANCDWFLDLARIPFGPVRTISSVVYVDADGANQTLSTSIYDVRIDGLDASIVLKYGQTWPSVQPVSRVTITASVGYDTVPEAIIQAMHYLVADWYANREKVITGLRAVAVDLPGTGVFDALLANFRLGV